MTWLAVFIGGGLGSLARFGVSKIDHALLGIVFSFSYVNL
jgi:fluoride ion exporter CrcB/FEX